ncbi:MAG: hypothetical protein LBD06_09705 [Candidatus Accumulibacter sp.]|nr:hypothetical protein [Accumulibacter sp.]
MEDFRKNRIHRKTLRGQRFERTEDSVRGQKTEDRRQIGLGASRRVMDEKPSARFFPSHPARSAASEDFRKNRIHRKAFRGQCQRTEV